MNILSEIKSFYIYYHTSCEIKRENPDQQVAKTSLCNRLDFIEASFDALVFLVNNLVQAIFYALAIVVTLNRVPKFKVSCFKNIMEGIVHAASIPISITGILFPQLINKKFLNLTHQETILVLQLDGLSQCTRVLGSSVFRTRWPLFTNNLVFNLN